MERARHDFSLSDYYNSREDYAQNWQTQEQSPLVGDLQEPGLGLDGARKRAFLVAKQFRFEKFACKTTAIDVTETFTSFRL